MEKDKSDEKDIPEMSLDKKYSNKLPEIPETPDKVQKEMEKVKKDVDVEYLVEEMPLATQQTKDGVSHVVKIVQSLKAFAHPGGTDK